MCLRILTVYVDKQRIQQAFLNLIKNALDSIDVEGTVSIRGVQAHAERRD